MCKHKFQQFDYLIHKFQYKMCLFESTTLPPSVCQAPQAEREVAGSLLVVWLGLEEGRLGIGVCVVLV